MKIKIYCLLDKDSEQYNQITFNAPNDKVAKRIVKNSLENDEKLAKNAKNYEVHCIGEFDTEEPKSENKVFEVQEIKDEMSAEE